MHTAPDVSRSQKSDWEREWNYWCACDKLALRYMCCHQIKRSEIPAAHQMFLLRKSAIEQNMLWLMHHWSICTTALSRRMYLESLLNPSIVTLAVAVCILQFLSLIKMLCICDDVCLERRVTYIGRGFILRWFATPHPKGRCVGRGYTSSAACLTFRQWPMQVGVLQLALLSASASLYVNSMTAEQLRYRNCTCS